MYRANDYVPSITKRSLAPTVVENQSDQEKAVFQFLMQTKATPNVIGDAKSNGSDSMVFDDSRETVKNTGRIQTSPSKQQLRNYAISPNKPYISSNMR